MATRTWRRNPGRLVQSSLLALVGGLLLAPAARAEPITYSTSGTVAIANEPDHQLYGLTPDGQLPPGTAVGDYPYAYGGDIRLGYVQIIPVNGGPRSGPNPEINNTPFDIKLAFNNGLPTLEFKGTISERGAAGYPNGLEELSDYSYVGKIDSVTSSDPALIVNLPAPFADIAAHPERPMLVMKTWKPYDNRLYLSLAYDPHVAPVPEPSSAAVFLGALGSLVWYARRRRTGDLTG